MLMTVERMMLKYLQIQHKRSWNKFWHTENVFNENVKNGIRSMESKVINEL